MRLPYIVAGLVATLSIVFTSASPASVETLPVSEIQPGMEGEGLTVFSGEKVETFKVYILGVLHNFGPKQNVILGRLEGGPLAEAGVIAGMSGSPVYIDGKLIGAVAFSFPFSKEPIAGITPIAEMIEATATTSPRAPAARLEFPLVPENLEAAVSTRKQKIPIQGTSLTGVDLLQPYLGKLLTPIATPASFHGFSPETFELIVPLMRSVGIEPLMGGAMAPAATQATSSGSIELSTEQSLAPGGAVGVGLVRGDLDISATGTVTYVDPLTKAVYAFGHPLFNLGPIEYPMTLANVHLVLPSLYNSFKLSSTGATVGTWVQDRNVAIKGILGARPKMIPMTVQIKTSRGKEKSYALELVNDELFTPVLAYASLASILQSTERDFGSQTVKVSALVTMDQDRRVIIDDIFAGQQSVLSASAMVAAPLSFLMTNDFAEIEVKDVRVDIEATESLDTARLVRAWMDRSEVAPGGSVPLKVLLRTYRGEEKLDQFDIEIPSNVEEGRLQLLVADAGTVSTIERRMTQSRFEPRDLNQLIRALNGIRKNNRLYIRLSRLDRGGAIVAGEYLSSLPPSVLNVLEADRSSGNYIPIQNSMLWEGEMVTEYSVTGSRVLEITVKNP